MRSGRNEELGRKERKIDGERGRQKRGGITVSPSSSNPYKCTSLLGLHTKKGKKKRTEEERRGDGRGRGRMKAR